MITSIRVIRFLATVIFSLGSIKSTVDIQGIIYKPNTIRYDINSNILCDNVDPNTASFPNCNQYSDSSWACCYLTSSARGLFFKKDNETDGTFKYSPGLFFQKTLCVPIQTQSTPYPKLMDIAGLVYNVQCPDPIPGLKYDNSNSTFPRGTRCGPRRAYSYYDCKEFSLQDNSCCIATLKIDSDFEIDSCFFYGTLYNSTRWKNVQAQMRNTSFVKSYLNKDGSFVNQTALSNDTRTYFEDYVSNVYKLNQIGYADINCIGSRIDIKLILLFIIFSIFFNLL